LTDIFHEIDEELRHERYRLLWSKYRNVGFGVVAVALLGTAGVVEWQKWQRGQIEQRGAEYEAASALAAKEQARAIADLKMLGADGSDGYRLLARMQAAAIEAKNGDRTKAAADYRTIAADGAVAQPYRDLATILAAANGLGSESDQSIIAALQPLTIAPNAWRFSAGELTALAKLHSGDQAGALKIYQGLADDLDAPQSLRARAAEIIANNSH
jgi:hypothetical protein